MNDEGRKLLAEVRKTARNTARDIATDQPGIHAAFVGAMDEIHAVTRDQFADLGLDIHSDEFQLVWALAASHAEYHVQQFVRIQSAMFGIPHGVLGSFFPEGLLMASLCMVLEGEPSS